mgnify:CR=1 FL=1
MQNAAGNQVELKYFASDDDGVSGVVPAAVANHIVRRVPENVNNLSFSLVSPLSADDNKRGHRFSVCSLTGTRSEQKHPQGSPQIIVENGYS